MTVAARLPEGAWVCHNPDETFRLGAYLGNFLAGGEIILLEGALGAGKTIFVKGISSSLGIDAEEVTSPSFTLVNPHAGRLRLYHIDLYRLDEGAQAAHAVDLEELLADEQAVICIECAERMGNYPLPSPVWHIQIDGDGEEPRRIRISPSPATGERSGPAS